MCETAANLGEKIRAENGIAKAVAIVNQLDKTTQRNYVA
jgi:hypothetical protein